MNIKSLAGKVSSSVAISGLMFINAVGAANSFSGTLAPQNTSIGNAQGTTGATLKGVVGTIIVVIEYLAAALAVIYLIWNGIQYITSAGNPDKAKIARTGIINAVIGIIVIVAAGWIINTSIGLGNFGSTSGDIAI